LDASLPAIRKRVETILRANPLWNGGKWEVMISELGESSMVVRIMLGAANPEIAFQLRSQVQEHILDYLNQFKKGSLIGAVADANTSDAVVRGNNSTDLGTSKEAPLREQREGQAHASARS